MIYSFEPLNLSVGVDEEVCPPDFISLLSEDIHCLDDIVVSGYEEE